VRIVNRFLRGLPLQRQRSQVVAARARIPVGAAHQGFRGGMGRQMRNSAGNFHIA
jgi:hypothetical protein